MVDVNGIDSERLLSYVERIERLNEEIKSLQTDVKEIYEEICEFRCRSFESFG